MEELIYELVEYGNREGLIPKEDIAYRVNVLAEILDVTGFEKSYDFYLEKNADRPKRHVAEILSDICDEAYASGILKENSITYRDLFDTKVMGAITPPPSTVIREFKTCYKESSKKASVVSKVSKASEASKEQKASKPVSQASTAKKKEEKPEFEA